LNAIVGITSYYCVILKRVILHDGIKTIQNGVFLLSLKKNKKNRWVGFFLKKNKFFSTLVGCDIFLAEILTFFGECDGFKGNV